MVSKTDLCQHIVPNPHLANRGEAGGKLPQPKLNTDGGLTNGCPTSRKLSQAKQDA
jgi:hypothetical protein